MEYNLFSNSLMRISRIGFGCMSLPGDQQTSSAIINEALNLGINYFDTADIYTGGKNEILLGNALKGQRDKVFIASKGGNVIIPGQSGFGWDASPKHLNRALDASLKRLGTEYLDHYQLHGGKLEDDIPAIIECFEKMKNQGKIREYGISSIRPNVIEQYVNHSSIAGVMVQYSLLDRRPEEDIFSMLNKKSIGAFSRGALTSGMLIDKELKPYLGYSTLEIDSMRLVLKSMCNEFRNEAMVLLRFVLVEPSLVCAVTGFSNLNQLKGLSSIWKSPALTETELNKLKTILRKNTYIDHRIFN